MKNYLNSIAKKFGYKLIKDRKDNFPVEATKTDRLIRSQVKPYTMTSDQRLWALLSAIKYISKKQIRGDLVECGVWKGGSAMAMALQLKEMGETGRDIWLYDTFSGMTEPSSKDVEYHSGRSASKLLSSTKKVPGN
ncbi:MAG TPA: macrocin O-methyltransferase, partial [Bacteroidetes bacterium]|nr:macrocin O-methyltransferase [Bacteroidota bacterium]